MEVPAILLELRVAEMLCKYARGGGELGIFQMTDLIDLGEIVSRTHFQAFTLREAIREVFELHDLHPVPNSLPRPIAGEEDVETFRGIAERAGASTDHNRIFEEVAALFDPILSGEVKMGVWDAYQGCWVSGRPENGHDLPSW